MSKIVRIGNPNCYTVGIRFTHGESITGKVTKEYRAWRSIKRRCYETKNKSYKDYGLRGITVCDRWLNSYESFLQDIGRAPSEHHSIDRINNDGNYEPGNVRWATKKEQDNNRRSNRIIVWNGRSHNLKQWCDELNLKYQKTLLRLWYGWSVERAFTTP